MRSINSGDERFSLGILTVLLICALNLSQLILSLLDGGLSIGGNRDGGKDLQARCLLYWVKPLCCWGSVLEILEHKFCKYLRFPCYVIKACLLCLCVNRVMMNAYHLDLQQLRMVYHVWLVLLDQLVKGGIWAFINRRYLNLILT